MKNRIYFGHPINTYDTELETQLLEKIAIVFPEFDIENPNQRHHQEGYRHWKEKTGSGMDYYFKKVLPECRAGIFLPFRDGAWGAGIFGEAEFLASHDCPIYQITAEGLISQVNLSEIWALTIEETRTRIRTAAGETVPY